ncbi:MAG: outer membrane lipoprotein carrier protein LolA [Elusimicrobia bacterium]|nr:outer membrane lipoprotein carrier protein LolA [Elusimicrobiota bacterium]
MKALLAILLVILPATAHPGIVEDIQKQLTPFTVLRGRFQQVKTIKIIKRPLRSSGDFVLAKDKGALWRTLKPALSAIKITAVEVAQIKDGKVGFRMRAEDQPALRLISKVLFAVFSADVGELKRHFDITGPPLVEGRWKAELKPKEALVAKVVAQIRLQGGKTLEKIEISEANGDRTVIDFSDVKLGAELSGAESASFE